MYWPSMKGHTGIRRIYLIFSSFHVQSELEGGNGKSLDEGQFEIFVQ